MKERLKLAIKNSELNINQICKKSGVSRSSLYEYISGTSEPRNDSLIALSQVLNVSTAWLMGLESPMDYDKLNTLGKRKVEEYISDILLKYQK